MTEKKAQQILKALGDVCEYALCTILEDQVLVEIGNYPAIGLHSVAEVREWMPEMLETIQYARETDTL